VGSPANVGRVLLRLLPERLGIALHHWETCHAPKAEVDPVEQQAMAAATPIRFGERGRRRAWSWGNGPLVVLVHGWGGCAAQMAPLAQRLAAAGLRAVALDITGHGDGWRRRTTWPDYFGDLGALAHALDGGIHAYLGHSLGGLAVMGARRLGSISARHYVCVCSTAAPSRRVELLQRRMAPSPQAMARYQAFLASQFQAPSWQALADGWAYSGCGPETLLVYDLMDRFMSHEEGDRILAAHPQLVLKKLHANGHNRILRHPDFADLVGDFLSTAPPA
jgi:pimeloyl-ACP methyl ester carboxylesterase